MWRNRDMTRYADPQRCPDCGSPIDYGATACSACELPLQGPLAQQLFVTLSRADELLASLRAGTGFARVASSPVVDHAPTRLTDQATGTAPTGSVATPGVPAAPATAPSAGMSGASVPKILLGLGAGCLLVAALVFLAVTWSVMGVGGRTATLVGFTAITGGLTAWVAGRGLRGAVEALGLVTLGLGTLDVVGAKSAGWFGDLSEPSFLVLLGALLTAAATGACLWLRRTPSGAFTSGEVVAGIGVATAAIGLTAGEWWTVDARLVVATLAGLATVVAFRQLTLHVATVLAATVSGFTWLGLVSSGLDRILESPTLQGVWADGGGLPLLAAAALVGGLTVVRILPLAARLSASTLAVALAATVVAVPALDNGATEACLTVIAILLASVVALWFVPKPWSAAAGLTALGSGMVTAVFGLALGATAGLRLAEAATDHGRFLDTLPRLGDELDGLAAWLLVPVVAALCAGLAVAGRIAGRSVPWERVLPFVGVATAVGTAALYPLPIWVFVAAGLVTGAAYVVRGDVVLGSLGLLAGLVLSFHSDGLLAVALGVVLASAALLLVRDDRPEVRTGAEVVAQVALASSVWVWGLLLDQPGEWVAAVGLALTAAPALVVRRTGLELGAAAGMLGLFFAGVATAPGSELNSWVAVYLTLSGATVCAQSLLRQDRRELGWVGGLLLAAATWVRLADLGVNEPEPYTLPTAIALLVFGLVHLRRNPGAPTLTALSPGLALALVPSLLWVLDDPHTLRSLLLGLACLALVVAGAQLRWTAPLVHAATVGALVVLRHAAPYIADSGVPRWLLIGFAGALLVTMGVTWEQRVREARAVVGYVKGLR